MTFGRFLKEQMLNILIYILVIIFTAVILYSSDFKWIFVSAVETVAFAGIIVSEYLGRRSYYRDMEHVFKGLDKKYLLPNMIKRPKFLEGRITYDIMKDSSASMEEHVAFYKNVVSKYNDYMGKWITEIKDPIEYARAISECSSDEQMDQVDEYLDCLQSFAEQSYFYMKGNFIEKDFLIRELSLKDIVYSALGKYEKWFFKSGVDTKTDRLDFNVKSDADWISFILGEIIKNAVIYRKHQNDKNYNSNSHLIFIGEDSEDYVMLHVRDNGIGITEEDLPHVKEEGYSVCPDDRYPKASGIGLYLCERLLGRMGHELVIESTYGSGTTVTIKFPKSIVL